MLSAKELIESRIHEANFERGRSSLSDAQKQLGQVQVAISVARKELGREWPELDRSLASLAKDLDTSSYKIDAVIKKFDAEW